MEKYPLATDYLGQNWQNDELMSQLEEEIKKGNEQVAIEEAIYPKMEELMFDVTLVKLGVANVKENKDMMEQTNAMMQQCMFQITRMEQLLENAGLQDILYYAVQQKELLVQSQMTLFEDQAVLEEQQKIILESRNIVKEFRQEQGFKEEAEKKLGAVEHELGQLDRQWAISITSMTNDRNQKIVSIIHMSNLINELQLQLKQKNFKKIDFVGKDFVSPSNAKLRASSSGVASPFQSALDFINDFLITKPIEKGNQDEEKDESEDDRSQIKETPLRSILINRTEEIFDIVPNVPTKQVRFAPDPKLTRIVEVKSEENDWLLESEEAEAPNEESVDPLNEELEESLDEELEESLEQEFEEPKDEEEFEDEIEVDDEEFEEKEEKNDSEIMLNLELEGYEEKSGSDIEEPESDDKESVSEASGEETPNNLPENENDGMKLKVKDQKTVELISNKSSRPEKPKIISVEIISPAKNFTLKDSDDIPSTSTGIRNRCTTSQSSKHFIDLNEYEATPNKRRKVDEEEFPMTQPVPEFFKQPSSTFESNEDQSLRFSSPSNDINDDYLLNFSDDNDTITDGSYIL